MFNKCLYYNVISLHYLLYNVCFLAKNIIFNNISAIQTNLLINMGMEIVSIQQLVKKREKYENTLGIQFVHLCRSTLSIPFKIKVDESFREPSFI